MTDTEQAKRMARALRSGLAARSIELTHSQSLELIAQCLGHADWNTLCGAEAPKAADAATFRRATPVLRIFDIAKAKAFYVDLLGFHIDWEHRFEPSFPLYMQVSRGGIRLHLSEHHGDGTPGSAVFIDMIGLEAFHAELKAKGSHAGIEPGPNPHMRVLRLWDPFGSQLRFAETSARAVEGPPAGYSVPAS
ncbi:MAG TPA: glyoxalase superfamily protein [Caulobacteraceae bacterium]|jgi:catechol 2,3-dioxygenase-like lactoylglutathione lyase family enzyme|nr:glyoxalase superfamily protein [Caulobacteraceae bacterium]